MPEVEITQDQVEIVKEGEKYYEKTEVDIAQLIADQDVIIAGLQEQIDRAQATKLELQAKE